MKNLLLIAFFTFTAFILKAQCIRVYVSEKIKGIEIPIQRREFEVFVNDTLKRKIASDNSGFLVRLSLTKGKYNIKLVNPEFSEAFQKDVVVEESKNTDVTIIVVPVAAIPESEKKKGAK